jgi:hypothetical protein
LVGYESWLERDTLIVLDFDPDVVGVASQPFWLFWTTAEGKARSHAPDYFARLADGSARVIDCRPADRIKPRDAAFDAARDAFAVMGWSYEVVDSPSEGPAGQPALAGRLPPPAPRPGRACPAPARGLPQADLVDVRRLRRRRSDRAVAGAVSPALAP